VGEGGNGKARGGGRDYTLFKSTGTIKMRIVGDTRDSKKKAPDTKPHPVYRDDAGRKGKQRKQGGRGPVCREEANKKSKEIEPCFPDFRPKQPVSKKKTTTVVTTIAAEKVGPNSTGLWEIT